MKLNADVNPILFDTSNGSSNGPSKVTYQKESFQELWARPPGSGWVRKDLEIASLEGTKARVHGDFNVSLTPGQSYEVGIYAGGSGPDTPDPTALASLTIWGLFKQGRRQLIVEDGGVTGGTWHTRQLTTNVPTRIMWIGASRTAHEVIDEIPHLVDPDGGPTLPLLTSATNHKVEINPLLPGNHYFFAAVLTDGAGGWDLATDEFNTRRRKLTVQFPTVHIHNDGDPATYGEGEFWFRVSEGRAFGYSVLQEFHLPTQDIDDWGETDRPYAVGFAHVGLPQSVAAGQERVFVTSWGTEHDGIFDFDEGAGFRDTTLPLPVGDGKETAINQFLNVDCPPSTVGDDFHYSVDVIWSVEYVP
jgi:hypothetical protein